MIEIRRVKRTRAVSHGEAYALLMRIKWHHMLKHAICKQEQNLLIRIRYAIEFMRHTSGSTVSDKPAPMDNVERACYQLDTVLHRKESQRANYAGLAVYVMCTVLRSTTTDSLSIFTICDGGRKVC